MKKLFNGLTINGLVPTYEFWKWVAFKNKINLPRIGGVLMGFLPPNEPSKIQTF